MCQSKEEWEDEYYVEDIVPLLSVYETSTSHIQARLLDNWITLATHDPGRDGRRAANVIWWITDGKCIVQRPLVKEPVP